MNIEFLNLLKPPQKGTKEERRKIEEMNQFRLYIIHILMEMSQENSLCSYLKQTKMSLFFSFTKWEQEVKQVLSGGWYQWEGEDVRKRCGRVNIVQILCTHVCKLKNETCWKYYRNGGRRDKGASDILSVCYFVEEQHIQERVDNATSGDPLHKMLTSLIIGKTWAL
jgi:hypothetical protein